MPWLLTIALAGLGTAVFLSYVVAKWEYELEELSKEVPKKPGRKIEPPKVGKYIALQSIFTGFSFALFIAGKLPRDLGLLFIAFVLLFLLALTLLISQPLVFQLAPKFSGKMAIGFARAMTIVSGLVTSQLTVVALKPDAGPLFGILMLFASLGVIFYAVFVALTSAYEEGYYQLSSAFTSSSISGFRIIPISTACLRMYSGNSSPKNALTPLPGR